MSVWGLASKKRCYGGESGSGACDVRAIYNIVNNVANDVVCNVGADWVRRETEKAVGGGGRRWGSVWDGREVVWG